MSASSSVEPGALCVEARGLRFHYPGSAFALNLPDLEVEDGALCVIVGESGSGKTTLLHLLAGILPADEGTLRVRGEDLCALNAAERRAFRLREIGLVFQSFELIEHLSVRENALLPFLIAGMPRPAESELRELAGELGIRKHLDRRPSALSQGERQRVAICRALLTRPALVLADEPTGNLDPGTTARIMELLTTQLRARGATLLMVTHDHSLLPRFDQVITLEGVSEGEASS